MVIESFKLKLYLSEYLKKNFYFNCKNEYKRYIFTL